MIENHTINSMLRHIILKFMDVLDNKYNLESYRQDSKLQILTDNDDPYSISQRISKIVRQTHNTRIGSLFDKCSKQLQYIINNNDAREYKPYVIYNNKSNIDLINLSKAFTIDNYIQINNNDKFDLCYDMHNSISSIIKDFDNIFKDFYSFEIFKYIYKIVKNHKSIKLYKLVYNNTLGSIDYLFEPYYSIQFINSTNKKDYNINVIFFPLKSVCSVIIIKKDISLREVAVYYEPYNLHDRYDKQYITNILDNILIKYIISNESIKEAVTDSKVTGINKIFTGNLLNNLILDVIDRDDNKYFMLYQNQKFSVIKKVSDIKIISNNYFANKEEVKNAIEYIDAINLKINGYLSDIQSQLNCICENLQIYNHISDYIQSFLKKFCENENIENDFLDDKIECKVTCKLDIYNIKIRYVLYDDYNCYYINLINIQLINDNKEGFKVYDILNLDSFSEYDDIELIKKNIISNGGGIIRYDQLEFIDKLTEFLMKNLSDSYSKDNYLKELSRIYYDFISKNNEIKSINNSINQQRKILAHYKSCAYFEDMINNECNNITYNGNINEYLLEIQYYLNIHDNRYYANMISV